MQTKWQINEYLYSLGWRSSNDLEPYSVGIVLEFRIDYGQIFSGFSVSLC